MNLEYDLVKGSRGQRDTAVEERLCELMRCEAVTIVNNNAAALMLVLNTFGLNAEVAVSRGELVEIGGSFRLPELMSRAGCRLLEVGTTNRTRLDDFAAEIDRASMLLKVHPSNYHIGDSLESVQAPELATLATAHNIPSCVDLGSGSLVDLSQWGLPRANAPKRTGARRRPRHLQRRQAFRRSTVRNHCRQKTVNRTNTKKSDETGTAGG